MSRPPDLDEAYVAPSLAIDPEAYVAWEARELEARRRAFLAEWARKRGLGEATEEQIKADYDAHGLEEAAQARREHAEWIAAERVDRARLLEPVLVRRQESRPRERRDSGRRTASSASARGDPDLDEPPRSPRASGPRHVSHALRDVVEELIALAPKFFKEPA